MTAKTSPVSDLLLVRLLAPAKKPLSEKKIAESLQPFFAQCYSEADWNEHWRAALDDLHAKGHIEHKPLSLTPAGRAAALEYLGIQDFPADVKWDALVSKYLVPRALGLAPEVAAKKKIDSKVLQAVILAQHYQLELGATPTLSAVMDALACKQLGIAAPKSLSKKKLVESLVSRFAGFDPPLDQDKLVSRLSALATRSTRANVHELRRAILTRGLIGASSNDSHGAAPATSPQLQQHKTTDLREFAQRVLHVARQCSTGKVGDDKVFLSHVWESFLQHAGANGMSEAEFKDRLAEANREGLLTLSRADIVERLDPSDVADSEIRLPHATYHLVRL